MRLIIIGFAVVLLFAIQATYANDEIHLTSGDLLVGEVTEVNSEYFVIDTAFAKQLKIKHELVSELSTESKINIVFNNGDVIESRLIKSNNEPIYYQKNNQLLPLRLTELSTNSDTNNVAQKQQTDNIKYSGNIDVGLSKTSGNADDEDYYGGLMLQARTQKNRYTLEASKVIEKSDGRKTKDETFGSLQYDRFFSQKWYAFTSASFEEDLEELLHLRSTYSLGSGYQFFDNDDLSLKAEMGLAYVDEDFENDDDNHYAGSRWALDYEHALLAWLGLYHHHEGFFSLEDSDDITIRSSSGFKFPLNEYINAKFEANIDWDRSPADGAAGTEKEYIFTIGYEF